MIYIIDSFGLFQLPAATCLWIAVDRLLVHVEPVAPACQLMEVALFVALVVVVFYKRVPTLKVVYVSQKGQSLLCPFVSCIIRHLFVCS